MFLRYKWLSPDGDGTGADTSAAGAAQGNGGAGGQGTSDPTEIKRLHDEAASWRNKHKTATEEAATLKRQLDEATSKLGASETQFGVERSLLMAAAPTFKDPGDALKFVDMATILKLDADKRAEAITAALNKLATDKPYLLREAATTGTDAKKQATGATSPANPAENKGTLTREQIKAMSPDEIIAKKDEVFRVLSGQ